MKLYIDDPKAFGRAYAGVAGVRSTRSKVGVADAILVRAKKGVVQIASSTGKVTVVAYPDGCQDSTDGSMLLPRDRFLAILRAQEKVKGGFLTLELTEDQELGPHVKVTTSNGVFTLEKLDPDGYPALIRAGDPPAIEMTLADLKHVVALTRFTEPESPRYALGSICVKLDRPQGREFRMTACATDGRRLGIVTLAVTTSGLGADEFNLPVAKDSPGMLIPEHFIAQAAGLFSGLYREDDVASISFPESRESNGHICRIACRSARDKPPTVMVFPLGEGRFPDWTGIYPNEKFHAYRLAFEAAEVLQDSFDHVMAVGDKDSTTVDIEIVGEELLLHSIEGHEGSGVVFVPGGYEVSSLQSLTRYDLPIAPRLLKEAIHFFPPDSALAIDLYRDPDAPKASQAIVLKGSCREHVLMPLMMDEEYMLRRRLTIQTIQAVTA